MKNTKILLFVICMIIILHSNVSYADTYTLNVKNIINDLGKDGARFCRGNDIEDGMFVQYCKVIKDTDIYDEDNISLSQVNIGNKLRIYGYTNNNMIIIYYYHDIAYINSSSVNVYDNGDIAGEVSGKITKIKKKYTDNELYMLSHLIGGEAGSDTCSNENQLYVGSVVLNRMKSKSFPDTMRGVIFQKGQYACTWDGNYYRNPTKRTIENAKKLLINGSILPKNVVFQSGFTQGKIYKKVQGHYFCYQ